MGLPVTVVGVRYTSQISKNPYPSSQGPGLNLTRKGNGMTRLNEAKHALKRSGERVRNSWPSVSGSAGMTFSSTFSLQNG